jgi:hypothetical protein
MRSRICMNAAPARRTSSAPRGRKSLGVGRPLAEALRGFCKAQDRPDLIAQESDGDADEYQRAADHPQQEDVRVGGVGLAAAGEDAQHLVFQPDADFHDVGGADRIDPEGPVDLLVDLLAQEVVEDREERLGAGGGQGIGRQYVDL